MTKYASRLISLMPLLNGYLTQSAAVRRERARGALFVKLREHKIAPDRDLHQAAAEPRGDRFNYAAAASERANIQAYQFPRMQPLSRTALPSIQPLK